jgi:hypothetical protein
MNLHHTNACHGLGKAYVKNFYILIKEQSQKYYNMNYHLNINLNL